MFNWLIKLLGGYTEEEYKLEIDCSRLLREKISAMREELEQSRKNDVSRDPQTGRFVKKRKSG